MKSNTFRKMKMSTSEQKLDEILQSLRRIEKKLRIVPVQDRDGTVSDFDSSLAGYAKFARDHLKLEPNTIENHKSAILRFLNHSGGTITKEAVKAYLEIGESDSWKSNQVKALRKYVRDFLGLGSWIEDFKFSKAGAKIKEIPTDEQLARFCALLPYQVQMVFLILHNSGLRIGEVLKLRLRDIDIDSAMINASEIHSGDTKSSWISFVTKQTAGYLDSYLFSGEVKFGDNAEGTGLFTVSDRYVQQAFKEASDKMGISLNPHLLRTVFTEKCGQAGIKDKYVDAFCGRTPKRILAKHYTDYSPEALRRQYDMVEPYLTLGGLS